MAEALGEMAKSDPGSPRLGFAERAQRLLMSVFALDRRSLAVFRVALGLLVIADILGRLGNFVEHYTDGGVVPLSSLPGLSWSHWSVYLLNSSSPFQLFCLVLTALMGGCLILGYRTRLMVWVGWILISSLLVRNPLVINAGDRVLRLLFFWSLFLPLGSIWSLDRSPQQDPGPEPQRLLSGGTVAYTLQIACIYVFVILSRLPLQTSTWWQGQGVWFALHLHTLATPFGVWMRQFPELTVVANYATLGMEILAPILLLVPPVWPFLRLGLVLMMMGMHVGFGLGLDLGIFPLVSVVSWIPFLPGQLWDRWDKGSLKTYGDPNFIQQKLRQLQSFFSLLNIEHNGRESNLNLANPRLGFWWRHGIPGILIGYVIILNITGLNYVPSLPAQARTPAQMLTLTQGWGLFRGPSRTTNWLVIPGTFADGTERDIFRDGDPVSWEMPESVRFENKYWRKYFESVSRQTNRSQRHRRFYARYVCRQWNGGRDPSQHLQSLEVILLRARTPEMGTEPRDPQITRVELGSYTCPRPVLYERWGQGSQIGVMNEDD